MRRWVFLALIAVSGCLESASKTCADGRVCPSTTVCDATHRKCVFAEQLTSCKSLADGDSCDIAGMPGGVCADGVCLLAGCGDGVVRGSEQCDTFVAADKDECGEHSFQSNGTVRCTDQCTYDTSSCSGYCGDGQVNGDEVCDPGEPTLAGMTCTNFGYYAASGLQCSPACTFDTSGCMLNCGDGVRNGAEDCDGTDLGTANCLDFGFYNTATLACNDACGFDTALCSGFCGDRDLQAEETCDGLPPTERCQDYGYEYGAMGCSAVCAPDFASCRGGFNTPWTISAFGMEEILDSWGSGPNNIFAVGESCDFPCGARIARFNGVSWTVTKLTSITSRLRGVWGASANDVFSVGDSGKIVRFNGTSWTAMTSPTTQTLYAVWGSSATDVFAVGDNGTILHYDGNTISNGTWIAMPVPAAVATVALRGVSGSGPQDVTAVGDLMADATAATLHYGASSTWNLISLRRPTVALKGVFNIGRASGAYAYGNQGTIAFGGSSSWDLQNRVTNLTIFDMWGAEGDLYAVAGSGAFATGTPTGVILHNDGTGWVELPFPTDINLTTVWGTAGNVYAFGNSGFNGRIARFTGEGWAKTGSVVTPAGAWSPGPGKIIIVGGSSASPTITERPGTSVTLASGTLLTGVAGNSSEVFVSGSNSATGTGRIFRRATGSSSWVEMTIPATPDLRAITSSGPGSAFAVGASGTILKYGAGTWTSMTSNTTETLIAVSSSSPTSAFALAVNSSAIFRYDGMQWTNSTTGVTSSPLYAIWSTAANDVFAVGRDGTILHYNGTVWRKMRSPTTQTLDGVGGTGPGDVFAVGSNGLALHYDGFSWSETTTNVTDRHMLQTGTFAFPQLNTGSLLEWRRLCQTSELSCIDGRDDDCDGRFDCGDSDCAAAPTCTAGAACSNALAEALVCNPPVPVSGSTTTGVRTLAHYACSDWPEFGREVIYKFPATTTGSVTVTLTGTSPAEDLDLVVLATGAGGGCEPRNPGCINASSNLGGAETVTFQATAGQTYYVIVEGYGSAAGDYSLMTTCQ